MRAYIDVLDSEGDQGLTPKEREEASIGRQLVEWVVSEVVESRETLTAVPEPVSLGETVSDSRGKDLLKLAGLLKSRVEKIVEAEPDLIRDWLDERYTRELVDAVPDYVSRTLQFSRMEAKQVPSEVTNTYVREATRAYIMGLPQACVALCRAALEQGLKENLGYQL